MGTCFTRGDIELKAPFGMGSEFYFKEASGEFDKKYFEVSMDCSDKFQVYEGMNLIFLYWYKLHLINEKKREEESETQADAVSPFIAPVLFIWSQ